MKDKLTSADKPGWWLADIVPDEFITDSGCAGVIYWDGQRQYLLRGSDGAGRQSCCGWTNFRRLAEVVEPEVIEGRGQAVTKEQEGNYWKQFSDGRIGDCTWPKSVGDKFEAGARYEKAVRPLFHPPAPPPKPELVKVQWCVNGSPEWAIDLGDKVAMSSGALVSKSACWKVGE